MSIEALTVGNIELGAPLGEEITSSEIPNVVSQVGQTAIKSTYNHAFHTNLLSVTSGSVGLANAAVGVAQSFGSTAFSTPDVMNVRRYFSVLTGASSAYMGFKGYETAKKVNSVWGKFKGISQIGEGISDAVNGFIQGTIQVLQTASVRINTNTTNSLNYLGSALFCFSAFSSLFNSALDLKYVFNLKKALASQHIDEYFKDDASKFRLGSLVGLDLVNTISKQDISQKIEQLKSVVVAKEKELKVASVLSVLFIGIMVLGDIFTAGIAAQVLSIAKLGLFSTFFCLGLKEVFNSKDKGIDTKMDQLMRLAVNFVSLGLAVTAIVAASMGTGGILPLTVFVIGISFSLFTLVMENRHLFKQEQKQLIRDDSSQEINPSPRTAISEEAFDAKKRDFVNKLIEKLTADLKKLRKKRAQSIEQKLAAELPGKEFKKMRQQFKLNTLKDFTSEEKEILNKIEHLKSKI